MAATRIVKGTIRRLGLEGGLWALVADDGTSIELLDPPEGLLREGARAEVELDRAGADVTIGMVGEAGQVKSFRLI